MIMTRALRSRRENSGKLRTIVALVAVCMIVGGSDAVTWYAYCEGSAGARGVAVFSSNFWSHSESTGYGRQIGNSAEAYFETRFGMPLAGCAGVGFTHPGLAEHSRARTIRLHTRLGDEIRFFHLPDTALPGKVFRPAARPAAKLPSEPGSSTHLKRAPFVGFRIWAPSTAPD